MPLVPAICTQCDAPLSVDSSREITVCKYCKTPFITEKAIHNYNTYNTTYNIVNEYNLNGEKSIETRLKNAEIFLTTHKDYRKATELFSGIALDAPGDYRTWWGIVRAKTNEFEDLSCANEVAHCYDKAIKVASLDAIHDIRYKWKAYKQRADKYCELVALKKNLSDELYELNQEKYRLEIEFPNVRKEGIKEILKDTVYFIIGLIFLITGIYNLNRDDSDFNSFFRIMVIAFFLLGAIAVIYFFIDIVREAKYISESKKEFRDVKHRYKYVTGKISETEKEIELLDKTNKKYIS